MLCDRFFLLAVLTVSSGALFSNRVVLAADGHHNANQRKDLLRVLQSESSTVIASTVENGLPPAIAQTLPLPPDREPPLPDIPPGLEPLPDPAELLPSPQIPDTAPLPLPDTGEEEVVVERFIVVGSTIFSDEQFAEVLQPFLNRPITFDDLLEARDRITELYVDAGYITSGAFIPAEQIIDAGIVTLQVLEGQVADLKIEGTRRLKPSYISSRLNLALGPPLNIDDLLQALQLLQLDPVIETISAELVATPRPGESSIIVQLKEADTFALNVQLSNYENPLLETFQQIVEVTENNLSGNADALTLRYQHAGRSNVVDLDYALPVSPRNVELDLGYSYTGSEITEFPFSLIAPQSETHIWEVGVRYPIVETPIDQVTLGLLLEQRISQSFIEPAGLSRIPFGFPGTGATEDGFIKLTTLQFSQGWQHQTSSQLIALDSKFRLGTSLLGATGSSDPDEPTTEFLTWQGQALWLQRLNSDWLLVARTAGQLADRPLVTSELFGLGGGGSVRGYRRDQVLSDNGIVGSLELQIPVFDWREQNAVGLLAPFVDYGYVWNSDDQSISQQTLASIGMGLLLRIDDRFTARLDYALPLTEVDGDDGDTWQESGFLFLMNLQLF